MPALSTILGLIELGKLSLPKFQRGFVWNRTQIRKLVWSLYHGYPVGGFLVWETAFDTFLLDGQQRITTLYGVDRGKLPAFSDGDLESFINIYFNVETEEFMHYGKVRMQNEPRWISVTTALNEGAKAVGHLKHDPNYVDFVDRVTRFTLIKGKDFHIETISGADWTLEEVVRIFNQINDGGTKLTQGDLAMAKISVHWPEARNEMRKRLSYWASHGYNFKMDWLLRCITALLTGHSQFDALPSNDASGTAKIQNALPKVVKHVDSALTLIAARFGLTDTSVLRSVNALPAMVYIFQKCAGSLDFSQQDRLLYWYACTLIWGHYSTSVETRIRQDLQAIDNAKDNDKDPIDALIERLDQTGSQFQVATRDFDAAEARSRIFPLLYLLSRVYGARDLCSGLVLNKLDLGGAGNLERHHIFPRAYLRKHQITDRKRVNALANFIWLTEPCNKCIGATPPEDYLAYYEKKNPGVLASQWIPPNRPDLWKVENYEKFLHERRKLLADAANEFLNKLLHGELPASDARSFPRELTAVPRPISISSNEEEAALLRMMDWMKEKGLPSGELGFELPLQENGDVIVLDLAWPNGIQEGLSRKVALLIDETQETLAIVNHADYEYFTNVDELKRHVLHVILGEPA